MQLDNTNNVSIIVTLFLYWIYPAVCADILALLNKKCTQINHETSLWKTLSVKVSNGFDPNIN